MFLLFLIAVLAPIIAEQAPDYNSTACLDCSSVVCSTIPPDYVPYNATDLCFEGNRTETNYDYNNDPLNPSYYTPVCATCMASNYSYFYR